ncbi:vitamin B12 transporter [Chitinophaga ginsengisegetis]|uniref:Vitamin B12 transporter n=1 Tax=Chitinophaga ginsengisegetis TaxID=393003 RepID=A0A1T5P6D9_9BACT|nr:TonB-dependent receptor [Chitinophaga ginsengisegetis]SKD07829.1 vitamin B12 transporter [Chitinophaga ginsengisegetis]
MQFKLYTSLLLSVVLYTAATAQDTSRISQLNEITVTAVKGPQKAGETGKVVTILSHEYLQRNSGRSIAGILNQQTGLIINGAENNPGTVPNVYMRGASNGNTLILVDGLPVSDASQINNTFDLNFISPDQVERIEILRGSQSTLYGSNAVAGVINIITRKTGDKKFGVGATASYGSYHDFLGNVNVHGNVNRFSYLVSYKHEKTRGFSDAYDSTYKAGFDKDGFRQNSVFAKLGLAAGKRWNFGYLLNYSNYRHDLDEGGYKDETDYNGKSKYLLNGLTSEYRFKNGSWHVLYSYQHTKRDILNDSGYVGVGAYARYDSSLFTANTHQVESYVNLDLSSRIRLIGGAAFNRSATDQKDFLQSTYSPGIDTTTLSPDSSHTSQISVYASFLLHNMGGFNLEVGGRFNHHSRYGNNQTFSINPSYLINPHHKVFINISSAYSVPTLYQLYAKGYGNQDLKPETTTSYEAGYQADVVNGKIDFRVTGFARNTRDLVIFYFDPVTFFSQYRNANKQKAYGAEVEATWRITRALQLTANYTYVDGRVTVNQNGKDSSYYNLYRVPKHAVNATLGYQATQALYVAATCKYIDKRFEGTRPMGDYYTVDLYGEYKFGNLLKIFAGFRNITDYQYFDISGYNSRRFNFNTGIVFNL